MGAVHIRFTENDCFFAATALQERRRTCLYLAHAKVIDEGMRRAFGYSTPLYRSQLSPPPPVLGVFTRAPVCVGGATVDLRVYHMIGRPPQTLLKRRSTTQLTP